MPVQSTQEILTGAAFTLSPQTGDQPPSFDRCVITNQSGYQLSAEVGPTTLILEPWTKDIVPTYGLSIDIRPIASTLIVEGAPAYVNALWLAPKDAFDPSALPSTVAAAPTVAGTSAGVDLGLTKTFWSAGMYNLSNTSTEAIRTLNFHSGWASALVTATSFLVPAGKQLVITNVNVSVRPGQSAHLFFVRSATTPLTDATLMYTLVVQPANTFGSPTAYVLPGYAIPTYFGESSLVIPAGSRFALSSACGAASAFCDIYFAGFLQDVSV